ncbi:hypothetical protein GQR58_024994 [Nymphon striatum]|nr:hypothetical protein GQR58_024994 [Nymphon striatum]
MNIKQKLKTLGLDVNKLVTVLGEFDKGMPQGDPLSPLLSSLFLAELPDYLDFDVATLNSIPYWKKNLDFNIVNSKFKIFGANIQIPNSSRKILATVEDVSLWRAWNTNESGKNFSARKLVAEGLVCDKHMQYDQILNDKGEPLYHRFGNTVSNSVSWILIWSVYNVNWTFFMAQPVDDYAIGFSNQDHSLLTMVHCSSIQGIPNHITSSLLNINEFVTLSNLQIRPFSPSSPVISLLPPHSESVDGDSHRKNAKPHLLRQHSKSRSISHLNQTKAASFVYTLVPYGYLKPVTVKNIAGFLIIPNYDLESEDNSERLLKSD